jgi:hypothetical protein
MPTVSVIHLPRSMDPIGAENEDLVMFQAYSRKKLG